MLGADALLGYRRIFERISDATEEGLSDIVDADLARESVSGLAIGNNWRCKRGSSVRAAFPPALLDNGDAIAPSARSLGFNGALRRVVFCCVPGWPVTIIDESGAGMYAQLTRKGAFWPNR